MFYRMSFRVTQEGKHQMIEIAYSLVITILGWIGFIGIHIILLSRYLSLSSRRLPAARRRWGSSSLIPWRNLVSCRNGIPHPAQRSWRKLPQFLPGGHRHNCQVAIPAALQPLNQFLAWRLEHGCDGQADRATMQMFIDHLVAVRPARAAGEPPGVNLLPGFTLRHV